MRNIIIVVIIIMVELITGTISSPCAESKLPFPKIQPAIKSFHFVDQHNIGDQLKIVGTNGVPLYLLECYLNAYDREDNNFDYSGDFECRLSSLYSKEKYSTLLTEKENPTRDWESRGRFLIDQLMGKCAEYPEYGRVRHFKLRGMNLTLEINKFSLEYGSKAKNDPWQVDRIKELFLDVTVIPDPKASSEITEPVEYIEPPYIKSKDINKKTRDCEKVFKK